MAGSYRHAFGVYVIVAWIRYQTDGDGPVLIDGFEGDVGNSSACGVELSNLGTGESDFSSDVIIGISTSSDNMK